MLSLQPRDQIRFPDTLLYFCINMSTKNSTVNPTADSISIDVIKMDVLQDCGIWAVGMYIWIPFATQSCTGPAEHIQTFSNLFLASAIEIRGLQPRICKIFEITRTIYSNSERSEQFLVQVNLCQKLFFLQNMFSPGLSLEFSCIELVIQWTICHIVG